MNDDNKIEEISFLLPFIGLFLLSPVILSLFSGSGSFAGIPLLNIYIFCLWLILIVINFVFTKYLKNTNDINQNNNSGTKQHSPLETEH